MEKLASDIAKPFIQWLAKNTWEQLEYLRDHDRYVEDFENERGRLSATVDSVELRIDEAKKGNKPIVDPMVKNWLERAKKLVRYDPEPTKCFGFCMNCFSQIARAKVLKSLTIKRIPDLIAEVKEFGEYAHAAGVPRIEFYSEEFMSFESRKENFKKLKKELDDVNKKMIGLQGMGGTGKSTMAIEVGKLVEKSNAFDKVILISVSTPTDEKRIRDEIARKLQLQLEEEKLLTHAEQIWNRIANIGKLLIILDDVWDKFNLKNIGIQPRSDSKCRCCVLLTTRYKKVCTEMSCQETIELEELPEEDALKLFIFHAIENGQDFPDNLKIVAVDIVNQCGRLPVIVAPVAKTLKDWSPGDWQHALEALKSDGKPFREEIVDENAIKFYNSLKFSYSSLKDKQA